MPKLLVIDDDIDFCLSIADLLEALIDDAVVQTSASGKEGITSAESDPPDIILLDLSMPEMDGFEASRRLKSNERTRNIPIIMLTGQGTDSSSKVRGLDVGADAFLNKPCDSGELVAQINVMLRIKYAEDMMRSENIVLKNLNEKYEYEIVQRKAAEEALRQHREELESIVQSRTAELHLLQEINNAVNTGQPLDEVLQLTVDGVRHKLDYSVCDIYIYHPEVNEVELMAQSLDSKAVKWIEKLTGLTIMGIRIKLYEGGIFDSVIRHKKTITTHDIAKALEEYVPDSSYIKFTPMVAEFLNLTAVIRAPIMVGDEVIGVIGVARKDEITEADLTVISRFAAQLSNAIWKSQTEAALRREYDFRRAIEDSVTSGITVIDIEGKMQYVNPAFCKMVGYSIEELIGIAPPFPYWLPEQAERIKMAMLSSIENRSLPGNLELKYVRKDGKAIDVLLNASFLTDEKNEVSGVLASILDITERKALEKQVLVASEEERQTIGHDLHDGVGQHLTGTAFMAKVLEDKLRKRSIAEADDMSGIVGNINEAIDKVRRIASGVSPVKISTDQCCTLFREVADYATEVLGLSCEYSCDDDVVVTDHVDLGQIYMIAREAIVNAAKHSGADSVSIKLTGGLDNLNLIIQDNGRGFSAAEKGHGKSPGGMGMNIMRYRAGMIGAALTIGDCTEGGIEVLCNYNKGANETV